MTIIGVTLDDLVNIVTIIGFPVLIVSIFLLWQQTRAATQGTMSISYQSVIGSLMDLDRYFIENPDIRPFFYDGRDIVVDGDQELNSRLLSLAELFLDTFDNMMVQKQYMPEYPWEKIELYFGTIYNSSPILRRYLGQNGVWFPGELTEALLGASERAGELEKRHASEQGISGISCSG